MTKEILDKKWHECIRRKFCGLDIYRGGNGSDPHHVVHKTAGLSIRWSLDNGVWLRHDVHVKIHNDPDAEKDFLQWFNTVSLVSIDEIRQRAAKVIKVDLDEINKELEDFLNANPE